MTKTKKRIQKPIKSLRRKDGGTQPEEKKVDNWKTISDDQLRDIVLNATTLKELNNYCLISCRVNKLCQTDGSIKKRKNFFEDYEKIMKKYNANKFNIDILLRYTNQPDIFRDFKIPKKLKENLFKGIDEILLQDKEFIREVIKEIPLLLKHTDFKNDKDVVMIAVEKDAYALQFASPELKKDKEVVLKAISNEGEVGLSHADEMFKTNLEHRDVVMAAVKNNGSAYLQTYNYENQTYVYENDEEIILEAVKTDYTILDGGVSEDLLDDREFVKQLVTRNGNAIEYVNGRFLSDPEIAMFAVKNDGESLASFSTAVKDDKKIVLEAVKQNGMALRFGTSDVIKDKEIQEAAKNSPNKESDSTEDTFEKILEDAIQGISELDRPIDSDEDY